MLTLKKVLLQPSSLLGSVCPSFRALSGRFKFTIRRHTFNEDSPCSLVSGNFMRGASNIKCGNLERVADLDCHDSEHEKDLGWGLGFRVWNLGSGVWGLGFGVWSLELRGWGWGE